MMEDDASRDRQDIRVLIIDDEEIVHASMKKVLGRQGYHTEAVFSAKEGLERLKSAGFSLVITDLMMPGMNGIELLKALRQEEIQVPIIMITGYPTIATALQAMRLGAMDYLAKPFTRKEILSPVKRALRQEPDLKPPPTLDAPETLDLKDLQPGFTFYLPHHSWARFQQDGLFQIGVEQSFLAAVGSIESAEAPTLLDLVDQGSVGIKLKNAQQEDHGMALPFTGQVIEINHVAFSFPEQIDADTWLLKLLPSQFASEASNLLIRE